MSNFMKTLIAFYSLGGNTKKLAQAISGAVGGDFLEIKLKKELPQKGILKFFFAGRQAMKKVVPEILALDKNPADFDLIFLGTPVWAGNFAPAIRSFLTQAKLKNKKIALFCAHGGDNSGKSLIELEKELSGNEVIAKIDFKMDGISENQLVENLKKISDWAKDIAAK
jgi:flavodoxin